jgi:MoxR-like ATPase
VDEINRAPAKVQSALLEAMEERQVTVAGTTHPLPPLFMVMATQNPIEQEGTYPLPEAQLDRFLMHVKVDHPPTSRSAPCCASSGARSGGEGRAGAANPQEASSMRGRR